MSANRMLREIVVAPSRSSARAVNRRRLSPRYLAFSLRGVNLLSRRVSRAVAGSPTRTSICYDCSDVERALTWSPFGGYRRWRVDTGEATGLNYDMTPILIPDDDE